MSKLLGTKERYTAELDISFVKIGRLSAQDISEKLSGKFEKTAPMDVHFDDKNVVQPDLIFVSIKRSNIIQKWIYGAPDFLVEILSKSTKEMDQTKKKKLYGQHDVLEYWIVNP